VNNLKVQALKPKTIQDLVSYISELVSHTSGNVLGPSQVSMVTNRIEKRLIDLNNMNPEKYYDYIQNNFESESNHLISLLTTHHTFFFREFAHFEFLQNNLDKLVKKIKSRGQNKLRVHCFACSRGQEVYSLAMLLEKELKKYPGIDYEIVGSDIDSESVKFAENGVYLYKEVSQIPRSFLDGNWERGTGNISHFARIKKHIREKCHFKTVNLLSIDTSRQSNKYDVIFCRNVFIYLDQKTIVSACLKVKNLLNPGAYFITGLSESLTSLGIGVHSLEPSVYSFDSPVPKNVDVKTDNQAEKPQVVSEKIIRVLCVDDSNSVLKILKRVFGNDKGFQIVGTATNGIEAREFLKKQSVDVMTLDIHMPEMNGIEYLESCFGPNHPKVVMISSASRNDLRFAQRALELGASDFVEKPALNNLAQRADEIKMKIKGALVSPSSSSSRTKIDIEFSETFSIENPRDKCRIFISNYSDVEKVVTIVKELRGNHPPLCLFYEGNANILGMTQEALQKQLQKKVVLISEETLFVPDSIYVGDFESDFHKVRNNFSGSNSCVGVLGPCSPRAAEQIIDWNGVNVLVDESCEQFPHLSALATDLFPWTSFAHVSTEILSKAGRGNS